MSDQQDTLLYIKIKEGDREAFNRLFEKHYNRLCNFAKGILKNNDHAEETVQDVFISIWENRLKTEINRSVIAFLYTCVKNKAYNRIIKDRTRKKYESKYGEQTIIPVEQENDTKMYSGFMLLIKKAIHELPEKCREIFEMSRFEGLTYDEIADFLNISVKTVENQMGIAFKKLRINMAPYYNSIVSE